MDVREALGVKIDLGPDGVARCVEEVRVGFMFAPRFHPAMRHAGPVRREIGIRTVFNVLGPLANPAGVRRILLGVPSPALGDKIARVLAELGTDHALVVHGEDGLDEVSPSAATRTWEVRGGEVRAGRLDPTELGLATAPREEITGGAPARNAAMARRVLDGAKDGTRTAILLNAGAAWYVAGPAKSLREGIATAAASAISVLTEPRHWRGSLDDLAAVRAAVEIPLLAKDIVVDELQLLEARAFGADLVLLVAEALDDMTLHRFVELARRLGMEALVEAHEPAAFGRAVHSGARFVGVNARDLRQPSVLDPGRIRQLHTFALPGQVLVAESGITSVDDARLLPARVDAVLVGTSLMRAGDPAPLIRGITAIKRTVSV